MSESDPTRKQSSQRWPVREDTAPAEPPARRTLPVRPDREPRTRDEQNHNAENDEAQPRHPKKTRHAEQRQHVQHQIGRKEARRLKARQQQSESAWFGLGMFGLVGWSVAIPTLVGTAAGIWIDARWDGRQSWTLMLLIGGLVLGCLNAWRWVRNESERNNE